jgi:6-phosphogluconate dehydrogenase (decarboxylating)
METGMISLGRMEAHMMRRLSHTDHQSAVYNRQRIPIDRVEVECGMALCGGSVEASFLTSEIASIRDGLSRRGFCWQSNRDYL